jgi:8-oxo-dGTP pyrophosphatase MutT (NUDIX family)
MAKNQSEQQVRTKRQYAALPFAEIEGKTMVLLVTSRDTARWVPPKGWAERDLSGPELAVKEAYEEAGVIGEIRRQGRILFLFKTAAGKRQG